MRESPLVMSQEELDRGAVGGFDVDSVEGRFRARPVVSRAAYDDHYWSSLEGRTAEFEAMMTNFADEGWREEYRRYNKLVVDPVSGSSAIVTKVPGLVRAEAGNFDTEAHVQALSDVDRARSAMAQARLRGLTAAKQKVKTYTLSQLFDDLDVRVSLDLTQEFVDILGRQAVSDPSAACRLAQRVIKEKGTDVVVTAGGFAKSLRAARSSILQAAEKTLGADSVVLDMVAAGDQVMCQGGEMLDGVPAWYVKGPAWRAHEVVAIARLSTLRGSVVVNQLLERQMLVCGIILQQQHGEGLPVSDIVLCSGPLEKGISGQIGSGFPTSLKEAAMRVLPVMSAGCVIASSVRLTETASVVNWHVVDNMDGEFDQSVYLGRAGQTQPVTMSYCAGFDLWVADHASFGTMSPWLRRAAVVGETARLVYAGLQGSEFSDSVEVVFLDKGTVVTTLPSQVRGGVSGAALVAESDGALLGVLYGHTYDKCVCAVLQTQVDHPVTASVAEAQIVGVTTGSDELYDGFRRRGLASLVNAVSDAITPLYVSGKHVASSVVVRPMVASTTANPQLFSFDGTTGERVVYRPVGTDRFEARCSPESCMVGLQRDAIVGEQVCVLSKDSDGTFTSKVLVVSRVESGSSGRFWLDGLPSAGVGLEFTGGAVLALCDAAVLGQFVMREGGTELSRCVSCYDQGSMRETPAAVLAVQKAFVDLHPVAWDVDALDRLVKLEGTVLAQYSGVGRHSLRAALMLQLARQRDDRRLSQLATYLDNPSWVLDCALRSGFANIVSVLAGGVGSRHRMSTGKLVEVFYSVLGMAAVFEDDHLFQEFVAALGFGDAIGVHQLVGVGMGDFSPIEPPVRPLSWAGV